MVDIYRIAGRYETTNHNLPAVLDISEDAIENNIKWVIANTRSDSPFQAFIRSYFGKRAFRTQSLNRFALSVELVKKYCPPNGSWVDVGAFCHDAMLLKIQRPDIVIHLASYDGCIIYQDENGLHYYDGKGERPNNSVYCQKLDLEQQSLDAQSGTIDLVTSFEMLEHLKYSPSIFMREVNRLLKLNGYLILTTPNATSATAIASILDGKHPALCPLYHRNPKYGRIHPLEYARDQLSDLVTSYGFELKIIASVNMTPFEKDEIEAMKKTRDASEYGMHWLVIGKKTRTVLDLQYPSTVYE